MLCTPNCGTTGEHACWTPLLDCMTVGRAELCNRLIYVPEHCHETMLVPKWGSFWSIPDASLNSVLVSDPDHVVLKGLMAESRGLTLLDFKKRSEYSSVTNTSRECSDEQKIPALSVSSAVAESNPSEIASAIPLVDPYVLTVRIMRMNATENAKSSRNSRRRKRSGVRTPVRVNLRGEARIFPGNGNPGGGRRSSAPCHWCERSTHPHT